LKEFHHKFLFNKDIIISQVSNPSKLRPTDEVDFWRERLNTTAVEERDFLFVWDEFIEVDAVCSSFEDLILL